MFAYAIKGSQENVYSKHGNNILEFLFILDARRKPFRFLLYFIKKKLLVRNGNWLTDRGRSLDYGFVW